MTQDYFQQAITLAIKKGGYKLTTFAPDVLNPLFWQALGRALGWKKFRQHPTAGNWPDKDTETIHFENCDDPYVCCLAGSEQPVWLYHALRYFELKLTNGDENAFWKELLT